MKLLRYGPPGHEKPGMIDNTDVLRDLSAHIKDFGPDEVSRDSLRYLTELDSSKLPVVDDNPRIGCILSSVGQFIGVGLNFADHVAEANKPMPTEPVLFMKSPRCLNGPDDPVILPPGSTKTDWEVELGVVIGRTTRHIEPSDALNYVAGYTVVNDISEREYQQDRGGTWDKGKGCDTFGPVGPWLVTADEIDDPQNLKMWLDVNGKRMQSGNTGTMIFSVRELIAYISRFMTLQPGDLITTGTPPGVGMGRKPHPVYLKVGDKMRLGIDKLGTQNQVVVPWSSTSNAG